MTFLFLIMTVMGVGNAWAVVEYHDYDGDGTKETYNVVYLTVGGSNGNGNSSTTPVNSWANAYKKLPNYTGTTDAERDEAWDKNIIVVLNTNNSATLLIDETIAKGNGTQGIPATITGVWPWTETNTIAANVQSKGMITLNSKAHADAVASGTSRIGADTKFKYIRFSGAANSFFAMYLHDATFDVGCVMDNMTADLPTSNGATSGRKAPDMQVFLFANVYNFTVDSSAKPDGGWPQQSKPVTLTIRSGKFGRILSNRITGTTGEDIKKRYVIGNPDHPLMCVVNVDIDAATTGSAWNTKGFKDDIAFLCAGMTQGVEYCDVEFNIKRGTIATLVGAMQGNSITNTPSVNLSNSSFFGRTKVTINPENDADVVIQRYFAGCLGRETGGQTGLANAAFYGQSILNMYGGTIESGAYVSAGGISGLKSADGAHHTTDKFIPYVDASANKYYPYMGITYKTYDASKSMPKVTTTLHGSVEVIDLEDTKTEFNIYGGVIKGGLYGGSFGFSQEMPTERTMAGAGSLWGETNVNIYGGTITGGVYGGGMGDPTYYNTAANSRKADFLTVASVYGDTHVNIYGGAISGGIFGGGKGIPYQAEHIETQTIIGSSTYKNYTCPENEFLDIAKVYGNTNVLIDPRMSGDFDTPNPSWTFTGNIYGGGALGSVEGNTNVIIKGGIITGNIFGAGEGESGHPNKAKVEGTDNIVTVNIENGAIRENVYGGGNLAVAKANPIINISGGAISENVYGGGYGAPAVLTGNPTINVTAGTVSKDVYGGGALANVTGSTEVNIKGGTVNQDVYGGGALANVDKDLEHELLGNTTVNLTGGTIRSSYGGGLGSNEVAALIGGNATTTLNGSIVLGNIFGCNNLNGTPQGHAKVHVLSTTERDGQGAEEYDVAAVYGGGNEAAYVPTDGNDFAEVLIENCDNSIAYVYGGGNAAPVPATKVTIVGANAIDNAFAGGNGAGQSSDPSAPNYNPGADIGYLEYTHNDPEKEYGTGIATIEVKGGTIHHVYGGSNTLGYIRDHAVVNVEAEGTCTMDVAELYGGGKMAPGKAATINITCTGEGKIDNVYGGAHMADLTGDIELNIRGGNIGNAFGGNNESGTINGAITVNVNWDTDACGTNSLNNVYGAGNKADYAGSPAVNILNGTVSENVFGGGLEATVTGNPIVTVNGGTVSLGAYGGGALADVKGNTSVNIISGTVGNAYGGGLGQLADAGAGKEAVAATVTGNANVTVSGGITTNVFGCNNLNGSPEGNVTVTIKEAANVTNVYGGGNQAAASVSPVVNINGGTSDKVYGGGYGATAVLTGSPTVNVSGGTVSHDVYGGGALANVTGTPTVNVSGGTVTHDVYGGGALADVTGNTTVNLTGGAVGGAYGGALGSAEVAAKVNGDTYVRLDGSKVTETGIFGANNLNGTPTGHVKVHVTRTTPRDGQNAKEYDVPAVYGGGNLSAYEPTNDKDYAEVLIEGCDNSIDYVYGGGNAAPVPATKVTIYGANAINNAFAGGNGAGKDNPGADVGYKGYYSKGSREEYGTGETDIKIYGGTINNVYGGSNTLGYIRTHAYVEVLNVPDDHEGTVCDLHLGEVHAGGNEAEMYCGGSVTLACSEGAEVVYAGSSDADIHGDIDLVITSGTYGKVFGGNNHSGNVYGGITINIDETGCWPVMIGELYACGNEAPYSVYGYNNDKSCKTSGVILYKAPEINLISFTRIGKVFGGGYAAEVYGSPTINVEPITGKFANWKDSENNDCDWHGTPNYILDESDLRVPNTSEMTITYGQVGSIGTIYGGGNAGAVYGNTNVLIGTKTKNRHVSGSDDLKEKTEEVAVTITGNIFGGGNEAIVSGNTNVTIGENN